ncbi:MAG: LysE family translocator [Rhodospirillales bacterium]|nr:LysE family translocator [Rhodospirillales bacterium]
MTLDQAVVFNLSLLAALMSPGPAMLYTIRTTLTCGRAAGIATGLGLGTMAATWTLLASLGLDGLFRLFPWAYTTFKILGAAYLLYIAWNTWRGAKQPIGPAAPAHADAFLGGILVNLANPKSVLFAAAVLVVIFPAGISALEMVAIVGNQLAVEWIVYTTFAFVLSTESVSRRYLKTKPITDRVAAVILGGLGLRLVLER